MIITSRLLAAAVAGAMLTAGVTLSGAASAAAGAAGEAPAEAPPSAAAGGSGVWQAHKLRFNYMGFTTTYTCDGLRDKLRLLLKLTGAAPDFKVVASCARGFDRPDRLAMADLTFSSLQPDAPDPVAPGTWRHVVLSPHHPFDLGRGDCELVEEFRDRILPLFAVRNVVNNVSCVPHQDIGSNFSLSYDVFVPIKAPPATARPVGRS